METSSHLGFHVMGFPGQKALRKYHHLQPMAQGVWHSRKRLKRMPVLASSAPSEEDLQCRDPSHLKTNAQVWDDARKVLDASLSSTSSHIDMLQMLHETASMFQVAIEEQKSLTMGPWFSKAWLGIDHSAWIKAFAYQAAVNALLEATLDIARRQGDTNFTASSSVQKSLLRLRYPLEESIQQHLSARDPAAKAWFWNQQHPVAVSNFMRALKSSACIAAVTNIDSYEHPQILNMDLDSTLFLLSLSTFASIMKLGPRKLSSLAFSSSFAEETNYLMEAFVECSSIDKVYQFTLNIGLTDEFLEHFGFRAALHNGDSNVVSNERFFWTDLILKSLRGSLAREGLHSKLSSVKCQILDHNLNLAVFGFFAALGRRARFFLASKKVHIDDHLLSLFRYLEGGNIVVYPELATLSTYQLFMEVASEELNWIPFFDITGFGNIETSTSRKGDVKQLLTNEEAAEAIAVVLNVCSCWVDDFMLYTARVQQSQTVVTTKFLSNIQPILSDCIAATSWRYRQSDCNKSFMTRRASELEQELSSCKDSTQKALRNKAKKSLQNFRCDGGLKSPQNIKSMLVPDDLLQVQDQLRAFNEDDTYKSLEDKRGNIKEYKSWNFLSKSTKKLKDAGMDVLKGTQLLVSDVAVAITLIKRRVAGHTFTKRERKILHRTCTDLASAIPIGFLMVLPVTAVGHAAILAAIQKYAPSLIPSAYAPERLDLVKQLEYLREMDENAPFYL